VTDPESEPTRVGIALVRRGRAFLARVRPMGAPLAGYWEFPGGKCEPGESTADAARRECLEEAGLAVEVAGLRQVIAHEYPHGRVELHVYDCLTVDPDGDPLEHSGFLWVPASALARLRFPEANVGLLETLASEFDG